MRITRIMPAEMVDHMEEALSIIILDASNPIIRTEAQRLLNLLMTSSAENGGPAVISEEDVHLLAKLLEIELPDME